MRVQSIFPLLLIASAVHAAGDIALIGRPNTLPRGGLDLTLHGYYTNWADSVGLGLPVAQEGTGTVAGATVSLGADFGLDDAVQIGGGVVLPVIPGAGFGSVVLSGAFAVSPVAALRIDAGYERIGANGGLHMASDLTDRYFGGLGARIKVAISENLAFVSGRQGAIGFGHFTNVSTSDTTGLYVGASRLTEETSDFIVLSGGNNNSNSILGINVPLGLLLQPDSHFAVILQAGYSATIAFPKNSESTSVLHFVPVGIEAVLSPNATLDVGARFFLDGCVAGPTGANFFGSVPGYFAMRAAMLWMRIHTVL